MQKKVFIGLFALLLSTLACEPVIAVGKNELLCLIVLIVLLLGPPIYKFVRGVDDFLKHEKKDK